MENYPRLCTGSLGTIQKLHKSSVDVKFDCGLIIEIKRITKIETNGFQRIQLPLMIAFAATIDIVQGLTLDSMILSIKNLGSRNPGKVYTALSRCRSPEGIHLIDFDAFRIAVDEHTVLFDEMLEKHKPATEFFAPDELSLPASIRNAKEVDTSIKVRLTQSKQTALAKAVVYDFETCTKNEQEGHQPFANVIQTFERDKLVDSRRLLGATTSLDTFNYIMSLVNQDVAKFDKLSKKKKPITSQLKTPWTLMAYNGSGFDFQFLLQNLCKQHYDDRYRISKVFKSGRLVALSLIDTQTDRVVLKTHDLYLILSCSLDRAYQDYVICEKLILPFPWLVQCGNVKNLPETVSITLEDFEPRDRSRVEKMVDKDKLSLENYPMRAEFVVAATTRQRIFSARLH